MAPSKESNAMKEGCAGLIPAGIIAGIGSVCLVCACSGLIIGLSESGLVSPWVAWGIGLPMMMIVGLGAAVVAMIYAFTRFSSRLNAAFEPLGMQRSRWLFNISQYQGTVGGRLVRAGFHENRLANLTLHIAMEASLPTRMMLGTQGSYLTALAVRQHGNIRALTLSDPAFTHRSGSALDEQWASALLGAPEAREALLRLTRDTGASDIRIIAVSPSGIRLMLENIRIQEITSQNVGAWINDLSTVIRAAERLAPPAERLEPTAWDRAFFNPQTTDTTIRMVAFAAAAVAICLCSTVALGLTLLSLAVG